MSKLTDGVLSGAADWRRITLEEDREWIRLLDPEDVDELRAAAARRPERPTETLTRADVDLPRLGPKLKRIQEDLENGRGIVRLCGLPSADLGSAEARRIFFCLALQLGTPVSQDAAGACLLDVRDERFGEADPRVRGPHTNKRLSFHTDRCDVIAFLCRTPARTGGENHVISSVTLYNELLRRHPNELRTLCEPFAYLRHTVDPGNRRPFVRQPIFSMHEGVFAAAFLRVLIDRADRSPSAPSLTDEQRLALDTLESVAEDPELYVSFRQEAGDVLLLNNWITFHRRTAFEDPPDAARRRHLMRIWLSVPNSRPLAPAFRENFGATEAGALRGGIHPA